MALSTGMLWRYRRFEDFRAQCPRGDPVLQRLVFDHLDSDLDWLESLGAPVLERDTGNPLTQGRRFDPAGLVGALAAAGAQARLEAPLPELPDAPLVLACGGFGADRELVRRLITPEADQLLLRASPWSTGDGMRWGWRAGAGLTGGLDEFYGRALPAPPAHVGERDFVDTAQVYARHADVRNERGERYVARTWSEIDVVQWMARQPGARAWFTVSEAALGERVRERTVSDVIERGRAAGMSVSPGPDGLTVAVVAGITNTLGGLRVDVHARAAPGVFAAGADVGGIATGGYASGLAGALVLGRVAARSAVAAARVGERPRAEPAGAGHPG
jgi:hypothetical protein